jgi:hypothetical protein
MVMRAPEIINVNVNLVLPDRAIRLLEYIAAGVSNLQKGQVMASKEMDALQAEVERNTTVDESVKALVTGLAARIEELKNEPTKLQALADQLKASNDSVAAAVAANTPSDTGGGDTGGGTTEPTP